MPNLTRPSRVVSGVTLREEECERANVSTCGKSFVGMGGGGQNHTASSPHPITPQAPREQGCSGRGWAIPPGSAPSWLHRRALWGRWVSLPGLGPLSSRGALRTPEAGRLCRSGRAQQRLAFTGVSWQSPAHHQLRKLRLPRADPGPACCPTQGAAQLWIIRGRENPKPVWWQA